MFFLKTSCHPNFSAPQKNNNQILNVYRLFPQNVWRQRKDGEQPKTWYLLVRPTRTNGRSTVFRVERWFPFLKTPRGGFRVETCGNKYSSRYYTKMSFFNFQPVMFFFQLGDSNVEMRWVEQKGSMITSITSEKQLYFGPISSEV